MPSEPNSDRESTKDVDPYLNRSLLSKAIWSNVFLCTVGHVASLYGFYLCFTTAKWQTLVWSLFLMAYGGFGITGGAHRLWSHGSYKAKWPLRVLAAVGQTLALQHDIYQWCWNHRMHHKYSETDADPFNAKRGFFYSHIGWMLCEEHPEIKRRRNAILMNDLQADPIVAYQRRFYVPLAALFGVALPIIAPCLWWNETRRASFFVAFVLRYILSLNVTGMVNSVAHAAYWGFRPYDKSINSSENRIVAVLTIGEGWHNYHHVFPWDYKAAELGDYSTNWTTALIDWFAEIGWAYDRKTVPETLIRSRAQRTGDGTRFECFEDTILDSTPIQSTN